MNHGVDPVSLPVVLGTEPYVTIFTLLIIITHVPVVVALLRFVEKIGTDEEYTNRVMSKTIWTRKNKKDLTKTKSKKNNGRNNKKKR